MPGPAPVRNPRVELVPVALGLVAGMAISLQVFSNGRLGQHFGSPELAGVVNMVGTFSGLLVIGYLSGAVGRARTRMQTGSRLRWWHVASGAATGGIVLVFVHAAPVLGIAMLTVALVCGQIAGGLGVDRFALSTAGRYRLTPPRLVGGAIAIAAISVAGFGSEAEFHPGLLALVVLAGAITAVAAAGLSQMAEVTGEPLAATLINTAAGAAIAIVAALVITGGSPANGWEAPPGYWIVGPLCGVIIMPLITVAVKSLGVLRLTLLMVAGQSVGALLLDVIAPPKDAGITVATVVSLLLVLVAVMVSGRSQLGRGSRHTQDQHHVVPLAPSP